jgi:hypothetical protein
VSCILQFDKGFLDGVDGVDARSAAVFPPPRRREIYPGLFTKLGQGHDVKGVKPLHDSFIKSFPVMGVTEQWTDSFHLLSSLALTQYLVLTYASLGFYINCVNAISQQCTYRSVFMRYAKALDSDTLARDAALVDDLHKKSVRVESAHNELTFRNAQDWFIKKHECLWQEHAKPEERQR